MLPADIETMLDALGEARDDRGRSERLKRFGRALLDMPDAAARLLDPIIAV